MFQEDADYNPKKKELSSILAEKKRNYRNKIKEENPAMWCAMKQKEACKKREQREEKRFVLLEMQRMMHLLSLPESSETENHKSYLETLKERFVLIHVFSFISLQFKTLKSCHNVIYFISLRYFFTISISNNPIIIILFK